MKLFRFILFMICLLPISVMAQNATVVSAKKDTVVPKPFHSPRIATHRSLILPGLGQAYNREYWKIPVVYGALAIPTYAFFYNNSFYQKTKFAYDALYAAIYNKDSSMLPKIDASVKHTDGSPLTIDDYQNYRNQFRKDRDYSVLWFMIIWGLNVLDATVFAHLKNFDVSNDLSMHIEPSFNPITRSPGIGLVINMKSSSPRIPVNAAAR